ncbi:MAG: peptidylprolyl isomerase [Prevotella sp.]
MRHLFPFIAMLMAFPVLFGGGMMAAGATYGTAENDSSENRTEVLLETTEGNIRIALFNETPIHRDNFVRHIDEHFYDSVLFHRVIRNFMIQAGDPESRTAPPGAEIGESDCGYTLPPEFRYPTLFHRRGVVAMARESDETNPERRSNCTHFYIVWGKRFSTADIESMRTKLDSMSNGAVKMTPEIMSVYRNIGGTPHLDGSYTVFGEVTEGLDVVEKIQRADTDDNDRPVYDVRILRAVVTRRQ